MKNIFGLIILGLFTNQYGSAEVSHLRHSSHSQYLLPTDQNSKNGQDNHEHLRYSGYLTPVNKNREYLPPQPDLFQNRLHHQEHNIQTSYNNDYEQLLKGKHIDNGREQLEPLFSSYPNQAYFQPNVVSPINSHDLANSVAQTNHNYAHNLALEQHQHNLAIVPEINADHDGYHYPRPKQASQFLHPYEHRSADNHPYQNLRDYSIPVQPSMTLEENKSKPNTDFQPTNPMIASYNHMHPKPQGLPHNVGDNPRTPNNYLLPIQNVDDDHHHQPLHLQSQTRLDNSLTSRFTSSSQFGLVDQAPRNQLTEKGHINIPLPIPQIGYFFIPGALPKAPNTNHAELHPAVKMSSIASTPQSKVPRYSNTLLLPKARQYSTSLEITPSIPAAQFAKTYPTLVSEGSHTIHQYIHQQTLLNGIQLLNKLQPITTMGNYDHHYQHNYEPRTNLPNKQYLPPNNLPNRGLSLQNIARSEVNSSNRDYLPPEYDQPRNQHSHNHNHHTSNKINNGYLPPPSSIPQRSENYLSLDVKNTTANEPSIASAILSGSHAFKSYAPSVPYLPPDENSIRNSHLFRGATDFSPEDIRELNEPLDQQYGRIRTIQIINDNVQSVKNIKLLETTDYMGIKTIKILGHTKDEPMGEHEVLRVINENPHSDRQVQTIKFFADQKRVTLPSRNAYLPPPRERHDFRHQQSESDDYKQ